MIKDWLDSYKASNKEEKLLAGAKEQQMMLSRQLMISLK